MEDIFGIIFSIVNRINMFLIFFFKTFYLFLREITRKFSQVIEILMMYITGNKGLVDTDNSIILYKNVIYLPQKKIKNTNTIKCYSNDTSPPTARYIFIYRYIIYLLTQIPV